MEETKSVDGAAGSDNSSAGAARSDGPSAGAPRSECASAGAPRSDGASTAPECKLPVFNDDIDDFPEIEIDLQPENSIEDNWKKCDKNLGHGSFIPASKFNTSHLPLRYRTSAYLQYIKLASNLTVRVQVKQISKNRPVRDQDSRRGSNISYGSGMVVPSMFGNWDTCFETSDLSLGIRVEDEGDRTAEISDSEVNDVMQKFIEVIKKNLANAGCDHEVLTILDKDYGSKIFHQLRELICHYIVKPDEYSSNQICSILLDICQDILLDESLSEAKNDLMNLMDALKRSVNSFSEESPLMIGYHKFLDIMKTKMPGLTAEEVETKDGSSVEAEAEANASYLQFTKEVSPCTCRKCTDSANENTGYLLLVHTAHHVIFDDDEARSTVVRLFFDDPKGTKVERLYGIRMTAALSGTDVALLVCVTHDRTLVERLRRFYMDMKTIQDRLPSNDGPPLAVICSHPHGHYKHITTGDWVKRWTYPCLSMGPIALTHYEYTTPTCKGSSGGPVLIFGQKPGTQRINSCIHYHYRGRKKINSSCVHSGIKKKS